MDCEPFSCFQPVKYEIVVCLVFSCPLAPHWFEQKYDVIEMQECKLLLGAYVIYIYIYFPEKKDLSWTCLSERSAGRQLAMRQLVLNGICFPNHAFLILCSRYQNLWLQGRRVWEVGQALVYIHYRQICVVIQKMILGCQIIKRKSFISCFINLPES